MTIGELLDDLQEKLRTGEVMRSDYLLVCGDDGGQAEALEIRKISAEHVVIDIDAGVVDSNPIFC